MRVRDAARGAVFELAGPADDGELRDLLRSTPMKGAIEVAFLREPSYFAAARIAGSTVQTMVVRAAGRIAGAGTRALRRAFVNGAEEEAGYLGDLRLRPEFRSGTLLARGYRFLRDLHGDGRARIYSTVIVDGNEAALRTIAANRAGLPLYTDLGRVLTPMIHVRGRRRRRAPAAVPTRGAGPRGLEVVRGSPALLPAIVRKLNENRLQFAPAYLEGDFRSGRFPGLRLDDFRVLLREGRVAGVLAAWDQRAFRQTVAVRYHGLLRWAAPLLRLARRSVLPPPLEPLASFHVAFISTDDVEAFRALLARVHDEASAGGLRSEDGRSPCGCFTVGLHERDPRAAVLEEYSRTPFAGRLFAVTFDGPPRLDGRVPYVEAALL